MCFCVALFLDESYYTFWLSFGEPAPYQKQCSFGGSKSTKDERHRKISLFGSGGLFWFWFCFGNRSSKER